MWGYTDVDINKEVMKKHTDVKTRSLNFILSCLCFVCRAPISTWLSLSLFDDKAVEANEERFGATEGWLRAVEADKRRLRFLALPYELVMLASAVSLLLIDAGVTFTIVDIVLQLVPSTRAPCLVRSTNAWPPFASCWWNVFNQRDYLFLLYISISTYPLQMDEKWQCAHT